MKSISLKILILKGETRVKEKRTCGSFILQNYASFRVEGTATRKGDEAIEPLNIEPLNHLVKNQSLHCRLSICQKVVCASIPLICVFLNRPPDAVITLYLVRSAAKDCSKVLVERKRRRLCSTLK